MSQTAEQVRKRYERAIGAWPKALDALIEHDFELSALFVDLAIAGQGDALPPKIRALVLIAAHSACTYFDAVGLEQHMRSALAHGATREEILEVLELTSVLGIHSSITGFPILADELDRAGTPLASQLSERQENVKRAHIARRNGIWSAELDPMLQLQPELLDAYGRYYVAPANRGALDERTRELIYITIDSHTTHLYVLGLRLHIRAALALGVSAFEISQIFALLATIGGSTLTRGLPILARIMAETEVPSAD